MDNSLNPGFNLSDLQQLTHQQRHLVNWIRHQGECSLLDLAVHLCQDEETAEKMLLPLMQKGLIQKIGEGDSALFRVKYAPKRGQPLLKKLLPQNPNDTSLDKTSLE